MSTIYLIRHGEKPPNDGKGLSADGLNRAQALPKVFGPDLNIGYNIKYIFAEMPNWTTDNELRPVLTVSMLAASLRLTIDTSFANPDEPYSSDQFAAVAAKILALAKQGTGDVLVCWEHKALHYIVKAMGIDPAPKYQPDTDFDQLWTVAAPTYNQCSVTTYTIPVVM